MKNNYFYKYYDKVQKSLLAIPKIINSKLSKLFKYSFETISCENILIEQKSRNSVGGSDVNSKKQVLRHDRSRSFTKMKEDK